VLARAPPEVQVRQELGLALVLEQQESAQLEASKAQPQPLEVAQPEFLAKSALAQV